MAWNEPGGNNRDPWGGGGRDQGPPDLDEVVRKLTERLSGLLSGRRGGGGSGGDTGDGGGAGGGGRGVRLLLGIGAAALVLVWIVAGSFYIVDEGRRGVVVRFGRYVETTMPGLRWHLPYPLERVEVVDVEQVRSEEIGYRSGGRQPASRSVPKEALMLTQDENIVDVRLAVQYQVKDPRAYLFNVAEPDVTLRQAIESATREVIGRSSMDFVLTEGRADIVAQIRELTQSVLDQYHAGLRINSVALQDAQPPEEVQEAFGDAIKAREDEQRQKNEAEAYSNEIIPKARGQAARRQQEADAYKAQVVAQAEGEAARFTLLLAQYAKAPELTRERLYLETMEAVLDASSKVLVDLDNGGSPLLYLPLDRLLQRSGQSAAPAGTLSTQPHDAGSSGASAAPAGSEPARLRDAGRIREVR